MTTEQALREALEGMTDFFRQIHGPRYDNDPQLQSARAALALPPTPVRRQLGVRWVYTEWFSKANHIKGWKKVVVNIEEAKLEQERLVGLKHIESAHIQHRDVPEPGPWEDGE